MTDYLPRFERVAATIETERGPFTFFGLFRRADVFGSWDVVVSAPWLDRDRWNGLRKLIGVMTRIVGKKTLGSFLPVVPLERDNPLLREIFDEIGDASPPLEKRGHELFDLPVDRAYILRARPEQLAARRRRRRVSRTSRTRAAARA